MIIKDFQIHSAGGWTTEEATIACNSYTGRVFFSVPQEYENIICRTNADAFLVAFIPIAAYINEDIIIEGRPVSERLKTNIETILLPAFRQMGCGGKSIMIKSETTDESTRGTKGASGISLGIDCFYSLLSEKGIQYVISLIDSPKWEMADNRLCSDLFVKKRHKIAGELDKTYIPIASNVKSFYQELAHLHFEQVHTFCHLACPMILLDGIHDYYYSTGYSNQENRLDFSDTSHYDYLISEVINYPSFRMHTSGAEKTRFQKTSFIADNQLAKKYLEVCYFSKKRMQEKYINCTKCNKCIRTACTLEVLGELDKFSIAFDTELYQKQRSKHWGHIRYSAYIIKDVFAKEILQEAKVRSFHLPADSWLFFFREGIENQIRKIKRKLYHGSRHEFTGTN